MKKGDLYLALVLLMIGLLVFCINHISQEPGAGVKIMTNQGVYGVYSLSKERQIEIKADDHLNVIEISGGKVKMKEANCPNGDCLSQRAIDNTGQTIVCLPNQVLICIEGAGKSELDGVTH